MNNINKIKSKMISFLSKESFQPRIVGIFLNPFYHARKSLYKYVSEMSKKINAKKILDIGCGSKPYKNLFHFEEYIGIDIENEGHNHENEQIDVIYDGKYIPFAKESFDCILMFQVFEHVFEPEKLLGEINRVLKKNGEILLTVPFIWDEHEQPNDYARYTSFGLKYILEKHGFTIVDSKKTLNNLSLFSQLLNAYIYKVFFSKIKNFYIRTIFIFIIASLVNIIGIITNIFSFSNNDLYLDNIIFAKKN